MKNKYECQEKSFFLKKIRLFLEFWDCYQQVNTDGQFILSKTLRRVAYLIIAAFNENSIERLHNFSDSIGLGV
jgi:hypothetical protein